MRQLPIPAQKVRRRFRLKFQRFSHFWREKRPKKARISDKKCVDDFENYGKSRNASIFNASGDSDFSSSTDFLVKNACKKRENKYNGNSKRWKYSCRTLPMRNWHIMLYNTEECLGQPLFRAVPLPMWNMNSRCLYPASEICRMYVAGVLSVMGIFCVISAALVSVG